MIHHSRKQRFRLRKGKNGKVQYAFEREDRSAVEIFVFYPWGLKRSRERERGGGLLDGALGGGKGNFIYRGWDFSFRATRMG